MRKRIIFYIFFYPFQSSLEPSFHQFPAYYLTNLPTNSWRLLQIMVVNRSESKVESTYRKWKYLLKSEVGYEKWKIITKCRSCLPEVEGPMYTLKRKGGYQQRKIITKCGNCLPKVEGRTKSWRELSTDKHTYQMRKMNTEN